MKIVVVGASERPVCGVRDHARVLAEALEREGAETAVVWWQRDTEPDADVWLERVEAETARLRPDWVLWHYSAFTYGRRGIPLLAPRIAGRLAGLQRPLAVFLHEYALPFGRRGWRGFTQALTQRAALVLVLRASTAGFVTTERRLGLQRTWWLPSRALAFVPVFSNLPPSKVTRRGSTPPSIGIFGFAYGRETAELVAGAFGRLRKAGLSARVVLVGAPGPESSNAEIWRAAFAAGGYDDGLEFTGVLDPLDLATAISSLDISLFPGPGGPSSRKGTLAAALALGNPVVALDGHERSDELASAAVIEVTEPREEALATVLERYLRDPELRSERGTRAAGFYERRLAPEVAAGRVLSFLEGVRR